MKNFITRTRLRQIISEELSAILEAGEEPAVGAGGSKLSDQQKNQLNALASAAPSSLSGFSKNLKVLAGIIDKIDPKAANLNTSQLAQYWTQTMAVVKGMMSDEKTSSSETSKVTKALG